MVCHPIRVTVSTAEYLAALRGFDHDLMLAMRERVEELERRGGLPGVRLDLPGLRREHEDRERWLARRLARTPETDWPAVRDGVRLLLGGAPI